MKMKTRFLLCIVGLILQCYFNVIAHADNGSAGHIIAKFKIDGRLTSVKTNSNGNGSFYNPTAQVIQNLPYTAKVTTGPVVGANISGAYFFTDHIATELSGGYFSHKIKVTGNGPQYSTSLNPNFVTNWPYYQSTTGKFIPFAAVLQYHIAPYGKLSPYIGIGYHYTFGSGASGSKVGDSHGAIMQIGADGWVGENVVVGLDLKKTFMQPKVEFNNIPANMSPSNIIPVNQKLKINPLVISLGVGYRF